MNEPRARVHLNGREYGEKRMMYAASRGLK
jgi:hypothetical protein